MKVAIAIAFLALTLLVSPLYAATPCCGVVKVDAVAGIATARDNATGRTFEFHLQGVATRLKVGDSVYANFSAGQVSVDGAAPCCSIVSQSASTANPAALPAGPIDSARSRAAPATPCCNVVNVEAQTRMATARNNATGQTFQFKLQGAATSLKVGDAVYANFSAGQVSVDGATPCCGIVRQ
jgi:hypothetical protein